MDIVCRDVATRATDYAEGALELPERARVQRHLADCEDCRAYLDGLQTTARALHQLAVAPIATAQQAEALATFREFHRTRALQASARHRAPPIPVVLACTAAAVALQLLLARHPSPLAWPWLRAGAVAAAACALIALSLRRGWLAAGLATTVSFGLLLFMGSGELDVPVGIQCVLHEIGTAAIPVATLLLLERSPSLTRASIIGVAAAGALAGAAALHVTCPDASSLVHVLVFHVGGVIAAAALAGSILGGVVRKPGTAT